MKLLIPLAIVVALGLSACEVNTPAGAPGPAGAKGESGNTGSAGAAGATGAQGDTGKPAADTVIVVPDANPDAR